MPSTHTVAFIHLARYCRRCPFRPDVQCCTLQIIPICIVSSTPADDLSHIYAHLQTAFSHATPTFTPDARICMHGCLDRPQHSLHIDVQSLAPCSCLNLCICSQVQCLFTHTHLEHSPSGTTSITNTFSCSSFVCVLIH